MIIEDDDGNTINSRDLDAAPVKVELAGEMVDIEDMCLEDLMAYVAWDDGSERDLLWQFLEKEGLVAKADEFLAARAREEIREGQS